MPRGLLLAQGTAIWPGGPHGGSQAGLGGVVPSPNPLGWPRAAPAPSFWICWRQAGCVARSCLLSVPVVCPRVRGSQRAPRAPAPAPSPPRGAAARQSPPLTPPTDFSPLQHPFGSMGSVRGASRAGESSSWMLFLKKIYIFFFFFSPFGTVSSIPGTAFHWLCHGNLQQPKAGEETAPVARLGAGAAGQVLGVGGRNPIKGAEVCSGASSCPAKLGFVALLAPGWVRRQKGFGFLPHRGETFGAFWSKTRRRAGGC